MNVQARVLGQAAILLVPAVAGAGVAAFFGHGSEKVAASFVLFVLLAALAWTDAATQTVPDGLTFPFILAGLLYAAASQPGFVPLVVVAGLLVAVGLAQEWFLQDRGWIGSGDYLLFAGAIAWLGLRAIPDLIILSAILLGLGAIILRRSHLAMAPALSIAIAILWLGEPIP